MRLVMGILLAAMVVAACTGDDDGSPVTTSPVTTIPITTSPVTTSPVSLSPESIPDRLAGLDLAIVTLDGRELLVAVADDDEERRRGLQNVDDLGPLDGMLFAYDSDVQRTFWMKDVTIPLATLFFDSGGGFLEGVTLQPCFTEPCDEHRPEVAFRYVLEAPAGTLPGVGPGSLLVVP